MKPFAGRLFASAVAALAVCGSDLFAQDAPKRSDTVVKDATTPKYARGATLVSDITIGTVDGAEEYQFSGIASVLATKDGNVWVLDFVGGGGMSTNAVLRVYDADGKFLRTAGRNGGGPGEFQGPTGLAQLPDGRIVSRDIQGNRVNVYKPDGTTDTTWTFRTPYSWPVRGRDPIRADASGVVWIAFRRTVPREAQNSPSALAWVRVSSKDGSVIDTVVAPRMPEVPRQVITITQTSPNGTTGTTSMGPPYQPGAYVGLNPLGFFVTSVTNKSQLEFYLPAEARPWTPGNPILSVRRSAPPVPVSAEERAAQREQLEWDVNRREGTRSGPIPEVPMSKPFFTGFGYSEEGRVLAGVSMPSEKYVPPVPEVRAGQTPPRVVPWREVRRAFDVYEPDGTYLGRLELPPNSFPGSMRGNVLWAISRDDDGVNFIRRYRVSWQ